MAIHIVSSGETAESIAALYSVSPQRLSYDNQLNEQAHLVVGQALLILMPETVHLTVPGDTLYSIATQYGTTADALMRNNPFLANRQYLEPGEYLVVRYEEEPFLPLDVSGYAYPYINRPLLRETLPFLTSLLIFSYGFTAEGELIPPEDEPLLALAQEFETRSVLVLTPFSEAGTFNNRLVSLASNDMAVQNRLIENLLDTVQLKGYAGVDVDFEFILAEDRIPYAEFVRRLRIRMNEIGVTVSVAWRPKLRRTSRASSMKGSTTACWEKRQIRSCS